MKEFLLMMLLFLMVLGGLWLSLQFSGYKKRKNSGCCGGGHCETPHEKPTDHECCKESDSVNRLKESAI